MDPLGFALENFDAIGRWRDTVSGHITSLAPASELHQRLSPSLAQDSASQKDAKTYSGDLRVGDSLPGLVHDRPNFHDAVLGERPGELEHALDLVGEAVLDEPHTAQAEGGARERHG